MVTTKHASTAVEGCLETFGRCETVLDAVTDEIFRGEGPAGHPIGGHLRHSLDHAICFARDLPSGLIEYDARDRDPALETDREAFRKVLLESMETLRAMDDARLSDPIQVRLTAALDTEPMLLNSTVGRELVFLSSHTIHHLATVVHLCREEGVDLSEEMALAFSTAAYRKSAAG